MHLGIAGVGIATVASQSVSAILAYQATSCAIGQRCFELRELCRSGGLITEMLSISIAAGAQSALIGFSNIFVARYMNRFSTEVVEEIGIAQRLDCFVILPTKSFGITMTTFVGQNFGARQYQRVWQGTKHCLAVALGVTLGFSALIYLFTRQGVALFSPKQNVIALGTAMMRVLIPMFWIMAARGGLLGTLRGCGYSLGPTLLSLAGMVGVRQVFLAISMNCTPAVENIYYCYPVAWMATLLRLLLYYCAVRKNYY